MTIEFDFESDAQGWGSISSAVVSQTTAEAHDGVGSLKVSCASHSSFEGTVRKITEGFAPGEREQYEAWVKGPVGKTLRLRLEDDAGKDETFFEGSGDWRQVTVRRTIDPAATFVQIGVHVGGTQTTTFYVDDVELDLAPTEFLADWRSGGLSQWDLAQALPGRIAAVNDSGRFEVREGDVEPMTGSNRAEVQSGLEYKEGDKRYFRVPLRVESWDFDHWGIPWQLHDDSEESPPLCAQIKGSMSDPRLWLGPGDVSAEYWEAPFKLGQNWEAIFAVDFGKEGAVEVWLDREQQMLLNGKTRFEGIDTLGNPLAYDKLGIYRSSVSVGTAVVRHGRYMVSKTFPPFLPRPGIKVVKTTVGGVPRLCALRGGM